MKIFVFDMGYRGGLVVVADNREEAIEILNTHEEYRHSTPQQKAQNLEEVEIKKGIVADIFGDR